MPVLPIVVFAIGLAFIIASLFTDRKWPFIVGIVIWIIAGLILAFTPFSV